MYTNTLKKIRTNMLAFTHTSHARTHTHTHASTRVPIHTHASRVHWVGHFQFQRSLVFCGFKTVLQIFYDPWYHKIQTREMHWWGNIRFLCNFLFYTQDLNLRHVIEQRLNVEHLLDNGCNRLWSTNIVIHYPTDYTYL